MTTNTLAPSAFRSPGFRRLIVALAASEAGDWLYNLALVVVVFQRTHSQPRRWRLVCCR